MSGYLGVVFLPGLDGLGEMLGPARDALAFDRSSVLTYPTHEVLGYEGLGASIRDRWPKDDFVLVVDSFSGPVAIRELSLGLSPCKALVLVSSFARHWTPGFLLRLAYPLLCLAFWVPPPVFALRSVLIGWDAEAALGRGMRAAIGKVKPSVLARRFREMAEVDLRDDFSRLEIPILALQGSRDWLLGRGSAEALGRLNPRVEVETLDAPHLILQSQPDLAAKSIRRFLAKHGLGSEQD